MHIIPEHTFADLQWLLSWGPADYIPRTEISYRLWGTRRCSICVMVGLWPYHAPIELFAHLELCLHAVGSWFTNRRNLLRASIGSSHLRGIMQSSILPDRNLHVLLTPRSDSLLVSLRPSLIPRPLLFLLVHFGMPKEQSPGRVSNQIPLAYKP